MVATENFSAPTRHPRAGFSSCNAFDKYAFHIWVKFGDDEELQLLTANCAASSGKRAVCTIPTSSHHRYIRGRTLTEGRPGAAQLVLPHKAIPLMRLVHVRDNCNLYYGLHCGSAQASKSASASVIWNLHLIWSHALWGLRVPSCCMQRWVLCWPSCVFRRH